MIKGTDKTSLQPQDSLQRPFKLCAPSKEIELILRKMNQILSVLHDGKKIVPNICDLSYGSGVDLDCVKLAPIRTVGGDGLPLALENGFKRICNWVITENIEFMGGLKFSGWSLEVEIDYYPHREHAMTEGGFGMHRDDYVRPGDSSSKGGVAFVALVFLNEAPILGSELLVDLGPEFLSPSLTLPQIGSLPKELCKRVLRAKQRELKRRLNGEVVIECPIVGPYGTVCFCEPLVIHQSPVSYQTPTTFGYSSDHATVAEKWPKTRPGWFDLPPPKNIKSAFFPVNLQGKDGLCTIERRVDEYYGKETEFYDETRTYGDVINNTFNNSRSLIRLTFRTIKGPPNF